MFERRLHVLLIVLAVVCCGLAVRAFSLQVVGRSGWAKKSEDALSDERQIPTVRGRILDVKGRELAVDQPCIDACVQYFAIAASRDSTWAATSDEGKWLNGIARNRLKAKLDDYLERPLAERKKLLAAEAERVKADIDVMWHELTVLSGKSEDDIDEVRRQIVRRVETRRRLAWVKKYDEAAKTAAKPSFISRLLGAGQAELDSFDVHVSEERDAHIILPNIDYALRNELARRAARYPGLVLREGVIRNYPYGSVACQTIGRTAKVTSEDLVADPKQNDPLVKYAPTDEIGREGMEQLFEQNLRGTRGLETQNDADDAGNVQETPAIPGGDVTTTIDVELQGKVEAAFKDIDFFVNKSIGITPQEMPGAAVVIDLASGEIRAMASWPTYDLNKWNENYAQLSRDQINRPLQNRATTLDVEPGSTVKPIIGIGAITAGLFGPMETIHCGGFVVINGRTHKDFGRCWTESMFHTDHQHTPSAAPHPTGDLTFPEALQRSCNVFHEELAYRLGIGGVSFWFDKFGLGKTVGIGLPEKKGLLPDSWEGPPVQRMSIACLAGIGESQVRATPIQMANVASTLARGGIAIRPTLLAGERHEAIDLGLNPQAIAEARQGMFNVVNTAAGTGRAAQMEDGLILSAKTGSAQTGPLRPPRRDALNNRVRDANGRVIYDDVMLGTHLRPNPIAPWYRAIGEIEEKVPAHGWMIGYAPSDHPTVAFAVLVEYGGGGGPAAGSVVRKLLTACEELGYVKRN